MGFEALSKADLERIAAIDGAPVEDRDLPGGGQFAQLADPDGLPVDVVHGIVKPEPLSSPNRQPLNFGDDRGRLGERVSFETGKRCVKRLGHCVLNVTDFRTSEAWYKERFGFITSDEVYMGEESRVLGAFMRCNRGERFVDHHTLFLVGSGTPEFNHAAFEVADWDTLMLGHDVLGEAGYEHRWGVAKHVLGSQVFDYWKDPHGSPWNTLPTAIYSTRRPAPTRRRSKNCWPPIGVPGAAPDGATPQPDEKSVTGCELDSFDNPVGELEIQAAPPRRDCRDRV